MSKVVLTRLFHAMGVGMRVQVIAGVAIAAVVSVGPAWAGSAGIGSNGSVKWGDAARAGESAPAATNMPPTALPRLDALRLLVSADVEANYWQVSFDTDSQVTPVVEYDTEGFMGYALSAGVGFSSRQPLFLVQYRAPFDGSSRQKELLKASSGAEASGMQETKLTLDVLRAVPALAERAGLKGDLVRYAGNVVGSLGVNYEQSHFFGSARALRNSLLVENGAYVDGNTLRGSLSPLDAGRELSYRTTFERYEITSDILTLLGRSYDDDGGAELRIGYYNLSYRRPTDNHHMQTKFYNCGGCATGSRYYIIDADFVSEGVTVSGKLWGRPKDKDANSAWKKDLMLTARVDYGLDDSIGIHDSNVSLYRDEDIGHVSVALGGNMGLTYPIDERKEFFVRVSGQLERHMWGDRLVNDTDALYRIGAKVGMTF